MTINTISPKLASFISDLNASYDERVSYQRSKVADKGENKAKGDDNIFLTIADIRKTTTHEVTAKVLLASHVDASFINRQLRDNARMNVKCIVKVNNIAQVIASHATLNSYTRSILITAIALTRANDVMTNADAQASICNALKARSPLINRYATNVAANTASTQSSSTNNALKVYNVFKETRSITNEAAYIVDFENATTKKLMSYLNIAA